MSASRRLDITLPVGLADMVRNRVASGAYASESEVIEESLLTLDAATGMRDAELRDHVLAIYDEMKADPSKGIPMDAVFDRVEARLKARLKREG